MSPSSPSATVKVPAAAATYTAGTMDPSLRSEINAILIKEGYAQKIQEHLLYSLNAHSNNWPTLVQNRALALLRSGEVTTHPALMAKILEEVRRETTLERPANSSSSGAGGGDPSRPAVNGSTETPSPATATTVQVNGHGPGPGGHGHGNKKNGPGPGEACNLHQNTTTSLALPSAVVDEALKMTREALDSICEIEQNGTSGAT